MSIYHEFSLLKSFNSRATCNLKIMVKLLKSMKALERKFKHSRAIKIKNKEKINRKYNIKAIIYNINCRIATIYILNE